MVLNFKGKRFSDSSVQFMMLQILRYHLQLLLSLLAKRKNKKEKQKRKKEKLF